MEEFIKHFINQLDEVPTIEVNADTDFRNDLDGWDSITALSVMAMVDDEYSVNITGDEMQNANTIGDLFNIVSKKL
jgi:acyl carrier protein